MDIELIIKRVAEEVYNKIRTEEVDAERLGAQAVVCTIDVPTAYDRLLQAIDGGDVAVVVAWHLDRLHRWPEDLEALLARN